MERPKSLNMASLDVVERILTNNPVHIKRLKYVYSVCERIIKELEWQDIATIKEPKILLCGTGSLTTTIEYMNHVNQLNTKSRLTVLDLSFPRLYRSSHRFNPNSVDYLQADAIHLPFDNHSFDRIETDRFLQFFTSEEKKQLISEWYRVLKPNGLVTTREHLVTTGNSKEEVLDTIIKSSLKLFGIQTFKITTTELGQIFYKSGFEYSFHPFFDGRLGIQMPLNMHIVARKSRGGGS